MTTTDNFEFLSAENFYSVFTSKKISKNDFLELVKLIKNMEENLLIRHFKYWYVDIRLVFEFYMRVMNEKLIETFPNNPPEEIIVCEKEQFCQLYILNLKNFLNKKGNSLSKNEFQFFDKMNDLKKLASINLHFNFNKTFKNFRGEKKRKMPNKNTAIEELHTIWNLFYRTYWVLKKITKNNLEELNFAFWNKNAYDDTNMMFEGHSFIGKLLKYENKKCPFCNQGKIVKMLEDNEYSIWKPHLTCNKCKTYITVNLNIRNKEPKWGRCNVCKQNDLFFESNLKSKDFFIKCESKKDFKFDCDHSWKMLNIDSKLKNNLLDFFK